MANKKLRDKYDPGDLNLLPIMNMICLLIPFLLLAAQFVKIGVILVDTPRLSRVPTRPDTPIKDSLDLTLVITDQGYYLKSRHGAECPPGVAPNRKLCFRRQDGKITPALLKDLQHHLWYLFANKYRGDDNYRTPEERHHLTVVPEPTVRYDEIVRTLDAVRDIPADATDPKPAVAVPPGGCALTRDKKSGRWAFADKAGNSVRDAACMYYRVTLALGSS